MVAVAVITAVGLLVTRPVSAVLIGIRDNERRTEALGYDTVAVKVWIFTIGGAVASLAGSLRCPRGRGTRFASCRCRAAESVYGSGISLETT